MISNASTTTRTLTVYADKPRGPLPVHRHGLGQGGLCREPVLEPLVSRLRTTVPSVLRIFVQEYYDMYRDDDCYNWSLLDESLAAIRASGAQPMLALCMKPKALYPSIDQRVVHPNDYPKWQRFVTAMVHHYNSSPETRVIYWEVFNEPDIGEDGGCPSLFEPADYCIYYEKTVEAILQADPHVKVGGPALAYCESPILPALLDYCVAKGIRLDFVSWHIYTESLQKMMGTISHVQTLLDRYPSIHCETILNEWNIPHWGDIGKLASAHAMVRSPYLLAIVNIFLHMGLDRSNYYHIIDTPCAIDQFAPWFSETGQQNMDHFWNHCNPQGALFGADHKPRPHYYTYQLLQSMDGEWLEASSEGLDSDVNVLAVKQGDRLRLLVWNYDFHDPQEQPISIDLVGMEDHEYETALLSLDEPSLPWVMANDRLPRTELQPASTEGKRSYSLSLKPFGVYMLEIARRV